jgi:tetratricopeptide (TPR) repeat protein
MKRTLTALLLILSLLKVNGQDATGRLVWEYYSNREYDKAAPLFLRMYEENKVKTYLNYYVNCLVELSDYDTAIKAIRKAIRSTRDITLYVDLGFVYESSGDLKKAEECYQEPLKEFPQGAAGIITLGNTYSNYIKPYYAESVYELGRQVIGDPNAFRMEMASVYFAQRKFTAMVDEYLAYLLQEPQYLPSVEALLQQALNYDVDQTLLQITREKTLAGIQQLPGVQVYYDLLVWVYTLEKKFGEAVEQTIAMDRRTRTSGDKVVQIARVAAEAGDYPSSMQAYQYLIDKGPADNIPANGIRINTGTTPYRTARIESLLIRAEQYRQSPAETTKWRSLENDFLKTMTEFGKTAESSPLFLELARINSWELDNPGNALAIIEDALAMPGYYPAFRTDCLLLKGDILLASGDPWEASFVYAMVDMENADNPAGAEARLKRARLSWFTGEYTMAMAQLDVLKGSTSKPVANDAFELSLLIRENISDADSLQTSLTALAEIDYLIFREKYPEAIIKSDSLLAANSPDAPANDDILYRKVEVYKATGQTDKEIECLNLLLDKYRYDYWGHKALFELACIYQDKLKDGVKATELLEDFLRDFPNSFYFLDARDRLKTLKSVLKK